VLGAGHSSHFFPRESGEVRGEDEHGSKVSQPDQRDPDEAGTRPCHDIISNLLDLEGLTQCQTKAVVDELLDVQGVDTVSLEL